MDISVVVPAYRAAAFIGDSVLRLDRFLAEGASSYEIVVVDDGSDDGTSDAASAAGRPTVRVLTLERNHGKFGALKHGLLAATGRCRIFTDADLPYELEGIRYVADLVLGRGFHVVTGDRNLPESQYAERLPWLRRTSSRWFAHAVRLLVTGGLHDTQCGLKGFRGDVADALFPLVLEEGFAGDVEVLYIALKYNLEIRRIPVRLQRAAPSSVRVSRHAAGMLRSVIRLPRNWRRGAYRSDALAALSRQAYWETSPR